MSNRNEDRTLSGSTQIYADILDLPSTINAIRVRNNFGLAGEVLSKNPITNKLEFAVVPIADGTITTAMIKDLAVTDAKIANATITDDKISNATITGGKLATDIAITTSGNVSLNGATTTIGVDNTDTLTTKGNIIFNNGATAVGTLLASTGTITMPTGTFASGLNVGSSSELVVGAGVATFGAETRFGGELSMVSGGTEVFDMNAHNITDCGGLAMTTGGDITNVDQIEVNVITCNTLNLNTELSMDGISLDLGAGNLDCNNINATGSIRIDYAGANKVLLNHTNGVISCFGLGCQGGIIDSEGGVIRSGGAVIDSEGGIIRSGGADIETEGGELKTLNGLIDAGNGNISTTTNVNCNSINANNILGTVSLSGIMNVGYGLISSNSNGFIEGYGTNLNIDLYTGSINCKALDTQNSDINTGTGSIECGTIDCKAIDTQNSNIATGTGHITTGGLYAHGISGGSSMNIIGFNVDDTTNDIPRDIAYKSLNADHAINRNAGTSYIYLDQTNLNIAFYVPPSLKVAVRIGAYVLAQNKVVYMKLVNSAGTEFFTAYINDTSIGKSTTDTMIYHGPNIANNRVYLESVFFFTFPSARRGTLVNLTPMVKSSTGTTTFFIGETSSQNYLPMYSKATSMGSGSSFVNTILTAGDDY